MTTTTTTPTARCFKQVCTKAPTKVYSSMPGVIIRACPEHHDAAENLARTGRS